jgi:predicted transcriptional regulator
VIRRWCTVAKIKIGTAIDRDLMARVRELAAKECKHLNEILEESLEQYLSSRGSDQRLHAVRSSRGRLRASPELVKEVLEEPYLDT